MKESVTEVTHLTFLESELKMSLTSERPEMGQEMGNTGLKQAFYSAYLNKINLFPSEILLKKVLLFAG